jgi:RNA polymerase sigma factor (sigma-70 family)
MSRNQLAPLLWHVRRAVDGDHEQDAEAAFQATFLVLACKANTIRHGRAVGSWLHEVACHIAVKARTRSARQRACEQKTIAVPARDPAVDLVWRDLRPVLDEELNRLPEVYRQPLILCCLEGLTQEEAARQLGWTKGTVSGRIARARQLLQGRLVRRDITLTSVALATLLMRSAAEVQKRIEALQEKIDAGSSAPERVVMLRRLELLEQLGTPEAKRFLEKLADGEPAAEITVEAKRALDRLSRRSVP